MDRSLSEPEYGAFDADDEYVLNIIADYGHPGDLAFAEVAQTFHSESDNIADVNAVSVPSFNTVATGFQLGQLGKYTEQPENLLFFVNTAPREDDTSRRENNGGEPLVYGSLDDNTYVCGVDAGYAFSFVKDELDEFYTLDVPEDGSQFRSRDIFPQAATRLAEGDGGALIDEPYNPEALPEPPEDAVGYIDGYGNIKTTIRASNVALDRGEEVSLEIGDYQGTAQYTDAIFDIENGEMAFAPGSSGGDDAYMELVVRGGNAADMVSAAYDAGEQVMPGEDISLDYSVDVR